MAYRKRKTKHLRWKNIAIFCSIILIAAIILISALLKPAVGDNNVSSSSPQQSSEITSVVSSEPIKESFAKVVSIGDIMVHSTQFKGAYNPSTNEYDFSAFFKEISPYFKDADLAVGNLEVTFGGEESGEYRGYPTFNTPDSLADYIKDAGINLLLTANNHSYDTGLFGLKRTARTLKTKGISFIGTRESEEESLYTVKEINGIKIGMADYTYETGGSDPNRKYLNGIRLSEEANSLVSSFDYNKIEQFYTEAETVISDMKDSGAEFIVFYIHWGNEYQTTPNTAQKSIAQRLANLGVDIIIGSHPHVIQPVELIHSEDGQSTTVCLYSSGNAVSNQRQEIMTSCKTGHTEDGTIFSYTLRKYGDEVTLHSVDIIPTWVNRYSGNNGYLYTIYPLEQKDWGSTKYGLNSTAANKALKSYERTEKIISKGLFEIQKNIGCDIRFNIEEPTTSTTE